MSFLRNFLLYQDLLSLEELKLASCNILQGHHWRKSAEPVARYNSRSVPST